MKEDIEELIEADFPNTFDLVQQVSDCVYQIASTKYPYVAWAVKIFEQLIWIMHPPSDTLNKNEKKELQMLSCLYTDYLYVNQSKFKDFLEKHNFDFNLKYRLVFNPFSNSNGGPSFLVPYYSSLSKEKPLLVITHKINSTKVRSCIVYSSTYLIDLFSSSSNIGEKFCIKQLLKSWICFSENIDLSKAEKIVNDFVEKNIPDDKKGYTIETISVHNPKLNQYPNYQEPSRDELLRVNAEIAEFLAENEIKPNEYEGKDAEKLNEFIFDFIYQKLEDEIKKYDESLLLYAYKQVESIEGKRELNRWQAGVDASKYTEYDYVEKTLEKTIKIATDVSSAKLIIEIFLKVNPEGKNKISSTSWSYFQALSIALHELIVIYEYIKYDIIPHKLIVDKNYTIKDERGDELFDHEGFYRCKSEITTQVSSKKLCNQTKGETNESNTDPIFLNRLEEVNKAFLNQYDFSLHNFIKVIATLGKLNLFDKSHFPLTIITEENIVSNLLQYIGDNVEENEINKILQFTTLDYNSYDYSTKLIPTNLLRRKERLNLCPLVRTKSGKYIYGNQMCLESSNLWLRSITFGDFPCFIDKESEINQALRDIHFYLDKELEKEASAIAESTLGKDKVETNILNFKRISASFSKRPPCGEIDLLAINEEKKIIFVIDAKNMNNRNRPYDIRQEFDTFFTKTKCYLRKLSNKKNFVEININEFLEHFGVLNVEGWNVKKAFVVDKVYHSAFSSKEVDFVLLQDLSSYLKPNMD